MADPLVIIAADDKAFAKKAAQLIMESTAQAIEQRKRATWSLCGGRTPKMVFPLLLEPYYRQRIEWPRVLVTWGDERCVPPTSEESNYKLAWDSFLSQVPVPATQVLRIPGEMENIHEAARTYEQQLKVAFRFDRPFPRFDLMMLGLGEDGHTASLFPGTSALREHEKWVVAHRVENLSSNRITVTFPVLTHARRVVFMCPGENKAQVLKEMFRSETPVNRYPAQSVKPVDGELIWLLDKPAASKLPGSVVNKALFV